MQIYLLSKLFSPFDRAHAAVRFSLLVALFICSSVLLAGRAIAGDFSGDLGRLGNFGIPTATERFLEEGRDRFDREIQRVQSPPNAANLLDVSADSQEELQRLEDPLQQQEQPLDQSSSQALSRAIEQRQFHN